jgi:spore germination protein YaaH
LLQERPELQVRWQPTTLTPWLVFIDQGVTHQIHFDNALSLSYKHQLVQAAGLAGVAYWALGYGPLP